MNSIVNDKRPCRGPATASRTNHTAMILVVGAVVGSLVSPTSVHATCLDVPGDVAGTVESNVVDVQCQILGTLWSLGGQATVFPGCYKITPTEADIDCDGSLTITDAVNTILLALSGELSPIVDTNNNQCVDTCEQVACTDSACDDTIPCTLDLCDPTVGCVHTPLPNLCDDGVLCTFDQCHLEFGCVSAPIDGDCDDGIFCTTDVCDTTTGCIHTPNAGACPSYNPCSTGVCEPTSGCVYAPNNDPSCFESGVVCSWSATVGETRICTIQMAKLTANTPDPVATSFEINYDPTQLRVLGVTIQVCDNGVCFPQIAPPQTLQPGGQQLTFDPPMVESWSGFGSVALWAFAVNPAPLTTAVLTPGGTIVGTGDLLTLHFKVLADLPKAAPGTVSVHTIVAATGFAQPLSGQVQHGILVVSATDCSEFPGSCNDNNVCTLDQCDPLTHQCVFETMSCEDGNPCVTELCDPITGCLGSPTDCNDGIGCTTDTCDPQFGCVHVPQDANCTDSDTVACTITTCDPTLGCFVTEHHTVCQDGNACNGLELCTAQFDCLPGPPTLCDDGISCTTDFCDPHDGCQHTADPTLCPHDGSPCTEAVCDPEFGCTLAQKQEITCYPNGAICMVSGPLGHIVDCTIRVARNTLLTPSAVGLEFTLDYDAQLLRPVSAWTPTCLGPDGDPPCIVADMPPATVSPGGQFLVTGPLAWDQWSGSGKVTLIAFGANPAPLSDAWFNGSVLNGDAEVFSIRFELLNTIPPIAPLPITLSNIKGTTVTPAPMNAVVQDGVVRLSAPTCVGFDGVCDDGIPCTTDQCNTSTGQCVYIPLFTLCPTDGLACTQEQCVVGKGCISVPLDELCQDGDPCNGVEICSPMGCKNTTPPKCDDGIACTSDACDPLWGCTHTPIHSMCPTAVGDCTQSVCDPTIGCTTGPKTDDGCLPDGAICALVGKQGQWVDCPIRLARDTLNSAPPVAIQFDTSWDHTAVTATQWGVYTCDSGNKCSFSEAPPAPLNNGAITMVFPSDNPDTTTFAAVTMSPQPQPLTDAYIAQGQIHNNAELVILRLRLNQTLLPDNPLIVYVDVIQAATASAVTMPGQVHDGVLVVTPALCDQNPTQCEDSNPCTIDVCDPTTQLCTHPPANCADGDFCTADLCDPQTGCYSVPLNCEDDTIVCTTTTCTPGIGCQHQPDDTHCPDDTNLCTAELCDIQNGCISQPVSCDDFDPCTGIEGCFADTGCVPGVPKVCNDGDLCTDDVCIPYLSCAFLPQNCDDGVACTLDGCGSQTGCTHSPQDDLCQDPSFCTDDICTLDNGCVHIPHVCGNVCEPDTTVCGDGLCDPGDCIADCGNLTVDAGIDLYQLGPGPIELDFGKAPIDVMVPGVGVGQWSGKLQLVPTPFITDPKGALGETTLILTRPDPFELDLAVCGQTLEVPVIAEALSLVSAEPIALQVANELLTYDIYVSFVPGQSSGQMVITSMCAEGGQWTLALSVTLRFDFRATEDPKWDTVVLVPNIQWKAASGTWVHHPQLPIKPVPSGVLVDRNHDGKPDTNPLLGHSQFMTLIGPGECSCVETSDCANTCTVTTLTTPDDAKLPMNWTLGGLFGVVDKDNNGFVDACEP